MRFKIDENMPDEMVELLADAGHDAMSVGAQGLAGGLDEKIAALVRVEGRALVTLDMDFADIRTYPPEDYAGIVLLRLRSQSKRSTLAAMRTLLPILGIEKLVGRLWVVDESGLRIRGERD